MNPATKHILDTYEIYEGMSYEKAKEILRAHGWIPVVATSEKSNQQYPEIIFPAVEDTALFNVQYKKEAALLSFHVHEGHTVANPIPVEGWFIASLE